MHVLNAHKDVKWNSCYESVLAMDEYECHVWILDLSWANVLWSWSSNVSFPFHHIYQIAQAWLSNQTLSLPLLASNEKQKANIFMYCNCSEL